MDLLIVLQSTPSNAIPISGLLICFIPLLTIILGFIVAARYTDRQATDTYLRILPSNKDNSGNS